jgi:hypothetical protein
MHQLNSDTQYCKSGGLENARRLIKFTSKKVIKQNVVLHRTGHKIVVSLVVSNNNVLESMSNGGTCNYLIFYTVKNAVELFFAFHPVVEKIQYH